METNHGVRPRRGRPRNPEAEPRIRRYAVELLLERGFDGMTVDDVADAAGVGKATIYRRWASKELLANDAMAELFDIEIPDADTGSIAGDLRVVYRSALGFVNSERGIALIRLAVSEANRDARSAQIYRRFLERRIVLTKSALDRARARGEPIRADADPVFMVEWLAGVFIIRMLTGQPMPGPDEADSLVEFTLRAICEDDLATDTATCAGTDTGSGTDTATCAAAVGSAARGSAADAGPDGEPVDRELGDAADSA